MRGTADRDLIDAAAGLDALATDRAFELNAEGRVREATLPAAGLTPMLFGAFTLGIPKYAVWALILLIIAALGGMFLNLVFRKSANLLPKPVSMFMR
jgi:hypothetical protein